MARNIIWNRRNPITSLRYEPSNEFPKLESDQSDQHVNDPAENTIFDGLNLDVIGIIFQNFESEDLQRLRLVNYVHRQLIPILKSHILWSITTLERMKKRMPTRFKIAWSNDIRRISHVKNLKQLEEYPKLTHIVFGKGFPNNKKTIQRHIHKGFIPPTVTVLDFRRSRFNYPIDENALPRELKTLLFNNRYNQTLAPEMFNNLRSLKKIRFGNNFNNGRGGGCTHICGMCGRCNGWGKLIDPHTFPPSLEELVIDSKYYSRDITPVLRNLPNLKRLVFGPMYMYIILYLPPQLEELVFGNNYYSEIMTLLQSINLKRLVLGNRYHKPILSIPPSLRGLVIGDNYRHNLLEAISKSNLAYLKIGSNYRHYLDPQELPHGLQLCVDKKKDTKDKHDIWMYLPNG